MAKDRFGVLVAKVALQAVLQRVHGAACRRGEVPVLGCVLLEVCHGQLEATAFDLEVGVSSRCNIDEILGVGKVAVPVGRLLSIVKALPGNQVELREESDRQLRVTAEETEFVLKGEVAEDFPTLDDQPEGGPVMRIDCDIYQKMIAACRHAVSKDLTKHNLGGINFALQEQRLTACAADGHRLSLAGRELDYDSVFGPDFSHVISSKGLDEILRLGPGPVEISIYRNQICFFQPTATLVIRLLDAEFPNYRRVIPTDHPGSFSVTADEFAETVARILLVSGGHGMQIEVSGSELTVTGGTDAGKGRDIVPVELDGDPLKISINGKYLAAALPGLGDEIVAKYKTGQDILVLLPADLDLFDERLELVMPIRLGGEG